MTIDMWNVSSGWKSSLILILPYLQIENCFNFGDDKIPDEIIRIPLINAILWCSHVLVKKNRFQPATHGTNRQTFSSINLIPYSDIYHFLRHSHHCLQYFPPGIGPGVGIGIPLQTLQLMAWKYYRKLNWSAIISNVSVDLSFHHAISKMYNSIKCSVFHLALIKINSIKILGTEL